MGIFKRTWTRRTIINEAKPVEPVPVEPVQGKASTIDPPASRQMTATGRDFSRFEGKDVRLKFWLPDLMDEALADLEQAMRISRSELVRMTLFQYLYGRYDYVAMQIQKSGFFRPVGRLKSVKYSRNAPQGDRTPELRKNMNDVSIFLPQCMKEDLLASAQLVDLPLSVHLREVLISELLGRMYLPDRFGLHTTAIASGTAIFESVSGSRYDPR